MTEFDVQLNAKIMQKVQYLRPRPKWQFQLVVAGLVGALLLLIMLVAFGQGFFVWNLLEDWWLFDAGENILGNIAQFAFFEVLILVAPLIALIYWVYQRTDWPLVRHKYWLLAGILMICAFMSGGLVVTSYAAEPVNSVFQNVQVQLEQTPLRANRQEKLLNQLEKRNIFVGKITEIQRSGRNTHITVQNKQETKIFELPARMERRIEKGDIVAIKYRLIGSVYEVHMLKQVKLSAVKRFFE